MLFCAVFLISASIGYVAFGFNNPLDRFAVDRFTAERIISGYQDENSCLFRASFDVHLVMTCIFPLPPNETTHTKLFKCREKHNQNSIYYLTDRLNKANRSDWFRSLKLNTLDRMIDTGRVDHGLRLSSTIQWGYLVTPGDPALAYTNVPPFYTFRKIFDDCVGAHHVRPSKAARRQLKMHPPMTHTLARAVVQSHDGDFAFLFHKSVRVAEMWDLHIRKEDDVFSVTFHLRSGVTNLSKRRRKIIRKWAFLLIDGKAEVIVQRPGAPLHALVINLEGYEAADPNVGRVR